MRPDTFMSAKYFGERFISSKYARPYRYKCRKARTNDMTNCKKKIHQYLKKK